jgi:hypothetical protein
LFRKYGTDFFEKLKSSTGASEEDMSKIRAMGYKDFKENLKKKYEKITDKEFSKLKK